MYEIKLNIEEHSLVILLQYLQTLQSVEVEKIVKKRLSKKNLSEKEPILAIHSLGEPLKSAIARPIRKGVTLQHILQAQNYNGTNWNKVDEIAKNLNIQEPLEDLLAQLKV
jgi:hypothetical protein